MNLDQNPNLLSQGVRWAARRQTMAERCGERLDEYFGSFTFLKLTILVFAIAVFLFVASVSFAEGVTIGGQDASGQMKDVQTMVTTLQTIGFRWVAPLMGGGLAVMGLFQIATRRIGMGILALGGGGALFAVERIANSLSHLAGN